MPGKQALAQADPVLKRIIDSIQEPFVESTRDVFFDLMSCVIEQQIHYRSTKNVFRKALETAGLPTLTPSNFHQLEARALPCLNLSLAKYETMAQILDFWREKTVAWSALTDAEVRRTLASIKGIGPWTIDMILLYTLQRPAVFPDSDFHVRQLMVRLYGLNPTSRLQAQMRAVAETSGEHKSLAVLYLLAWKESAKTFKKSYP